MLDRITQVQVDSLDRIFLDFRELDWGILEANVVRIVESQKRTKRNLLFKPFLSTLHSMFMPLHTMNNNKHSMPFESFFFDQADIGDGEEFVGSRNNHVLIKLHDLHNVTILQIVSVKRLIMTFLWPVFKDAVSSSCISQKALVLPELSIKHQKELFQKLFILVCFVQDVSLFRTQRPKVTMENGSRSIATIGYPSCAQRGHISCQVYTEFFQTPKEFQR